MRTKLLAFRSPDSPVEHFRKAGKRVAWPSLQTFDGEKNWVEHLESTPSEDLIPSDPTFNVTEELWDLQEHYVIRQVNDAVIATWHSHTRAMEMMRRNGDETALVLEDDVDIEWDIARLWATVQRHLPDDGWEMALLGHCWGQELKKPMFGHPLLHESSSPRCLHAYAMSRKGYLRALELLRDPWVAFQRAIDLAVPMFISRKLIKSFSIDPPLVIQAKRSVSDIAEGAGSPWRGNLMDSTLDRIARSEGRQVSERPIVEALRDPAARLWFKPDNRLPSD